MKDKNINVNKTFFYIFYFILLITAITLDSFYGPSLYSKVTGQEQMYAIGKVCNSSRAECENLYFHNFLDRIDTLSNESRAFFSNIYIQNDRIGYTGNCPCPYNADSRGGSCGRRSSYSKDGQISYCYGTDVSESQVATKKAAMIADAREDLEKAVQKDINVYNEKYTLVGILVLFGFIAYYTVYRFKADR